jgi:hypothetical protein
MRHAFSKISERSGIALFVVVLVVVCTSGVWSVSHYFNQDGTAHLYNAYLIVEILRGNEQVLQFASLNPVPVPNLTGHWVLAAILPVFGPAIATKLMVTLTFASLVCGVVWLRIQVAGSDRIGLVMATLFGCVLAFNWLWFLGFYNFVLAASGFAFTLGTWWRWRTSLTAGRAIVLALLLILTFFSHLVSFALLVCALIFLLLANIRSTPRPSVLWTLAVVAIPLPLVIAYITSGYEGGGAFSPRWVYLTDAFSPGQWLRQTLAADPLALMSRRSIPFSDSVSSVYAFFTPFLWLVVAVGLVVFEMLRRSRSNSSETTRNWNVSWLLLAGIFLLGWFFGPDDLGKSHGGYLRERTLILGLVCLVPWLDFSAMRRGAAAVAIGGLALILVFQTAVIWEYAFKSEELTAPFVAASKQIDSNEAFGSIITIDDRSRFRSRPLANITPLLGIGKNAPVWDNYEFGYYVFPVIASSTEVRSFVYDFRESNTFDLGDPRDDSDAKLQKLTGILEREHDRFQVLLVWNDRPEVAAVRKRWFEENPFFVSGELQLFRHR